MVALLSDTFLALLWRERIEVRVVPLQLALTLALSQRERVGKGQDYCLVSQ
jgi:hypothetical protein